MLANGAITSIAVSPSRASSLAGSVLCNTDSSHTSSCTLLVCAPLEPVLCCRANQLQCGVTPLGDAFFKVFRALPHLVGHMRKADDVALLCFGQGIQGRGFHFHRQNAIGSAGFDHRCGFPKRRIGRPTCTAVHLLSGRTSCGGGEVCYPWSEGVMRCGREIVIAGALIAQRPFD